LTEDTQEKKLSNKGNISKLQFHNRNDDLVLTLGKKEFSHYEHQNVFIKNGGEWVSYICADMIRFIFNSCACNRSECQ